MQDCDAREENKGLKHTAKNQRQGQAQQEAYDEY
jgi:hypothetical protein